jgi:hypothetical protein
MKNYVTQANCTEGNKYMRINLRLPALLLCSAIVPFASAEELPTVTPYRPTVSNPAALSQPGWLEIETGLNSSRASDNSSRGNLPYVLKLAFTDSIGVLLGGDAFIDQTDVAGNKLSGAGDTLLLLKQKWAASESGDTAYGLEYGFKSPTAKEGLGSGKTDYLVNGIYSTELSGNTIDLNANLTVLGDTQPGESSQQWGWATTWSRPLNDKWGIAAELSGYMRQGTESGSQFLGALGYNMNRRVVWDAGFTAGLSPVAPMWSVFAGVSILAGKLW